MLEENNSTSYKTTIAKLTKLYALGDMYNSDFSNLFTIMRAMVQQFALGGASFTLPVGHYIFGYNSKWVEHLYDERAYYDGKEVALDPFINQISNEQSTFR